MSTILVRAALKGCDGELLGCLLRPHLFHLHKLSQVALYSQVHTIFPPHRPWMINPGANTRPKLAN